MYLKAWNMSDGTVHIHEARCQHRRPQKTGRPPFAQEQVEHGKVDWSSKEAFCFDYWNNGILQEYEAEHGENSFDIWQGMEWKPCTDSLQDNEPLEEPEPNPKPAPAKPRSKGTSTRAEHGTGHIAWATKPIPADLVDYTEWLEENFPEVGDIDPRIVAIAVRTYRFFQKSNLSLKATQNGNAA